MSHRLNSGLEEEHFMQLVLEVSLIFRVTDANGTTHT